MTNYVRPVPNFGLLPFDEKKKLLPSPVMGRGPLGGVGSAVTIGVIGFAGILGVLWLLDKTSKRTRRV